MEVKYNFTMFGRPRVGSDTTEAWIKDQMIETLLYPYETQY